MNLRQGADSHKKAAPRGELLQGFQHYIHLFIA